MDGQHITNQVYHYTESIFFIMKNTLIIFFALLIMGKAMAQANHLDVNLSHNWNYLDRDVELAAAGALLTSDIYPSGNQILNCIPI